MSGSVAPQRKAVSTTQKEPAGKTIFSLQKKKKKG